MREEHQIERNRKNNRRNYLLKRDQKDREAYIEALEEARIRNRHIALMNEVRSIVKNILSG
jgi:hypothetical protein